MVLVEERHRAAAVKTAVERALANVTSSERQDNGQDAEGTSTRRPQGMSVVTKPTLERSASDGLGRVGAFEVQVTIGWGRGKVFCTRIVLSPTENAAYLFLQLEVIVAFFLRSSSHPATGTIISPEHLKRQIEATRMGALISYPRNDRFVIISSLPSYPPPFLSATRSRLAFSLSKANTQAAQYLYPVGRMKVVLEVQWCGL